MEITITIPDEHVDSVLRGVDDCEKFRGRWLTSPMTNLRLAVKDAMPDPIKVGDVVKVYIGYGGDPWRTVRAISDGYAWVTSPTHASGIVRPVAELEKVDL